MTGQAKATFPILTFVLCATVMSGGCSKPPDLDRVLGHTPAEVRDYLGDPESSGPDGENYWIKAGSEDISLGVNYRNGYAVSVVTLGPRSSKIWTEQDFRSWLGENCLLEFQMPPASASNLVEANPSMAVTGDPLSATAQPPCTPRVY